MLNALQPLCLVMSAQICAPTAKGDPLADGLRLRACIGEIRNGIKRAGNTLSCGPNPYELLRVFVLQRLQQHRVHNIENCRVQTNTKRKRQDRNESETR